MGIKYKIASANMSAIRKGWFGPRDALKIYGKFEFLLSREFSNAGRRLRTSQLKFIMSALDAKNRRCWMSVLFPTEILYPFGVTPLSLEILSGMFSTVGLSSEFLEASSETGMSNTMCSFHRLLIGLARSGYFVPPDFVGSTSLLCDGNLKSFSEVAKICDRPFLFLDIPYEYNESSVRYLKDQLEKAAHDIAGLMGVRYSIDAVRRSMGLAQEGLVRLKRIYDLRKSSPQNLFRGYEMANFCFPSHYLLGDNLLIKVADKIVEDLENNSDWHKCFKGKALPKSAARLMWLHIVPQYETPLWDLVDNGQTARLVCEEYTAPYFEGYDLDDPFGSIARRLILHPSNGPLERRIKNIIRIARDFEVDGIIHYSSWGCHQAAGNVQLMERAIESAGFKFLNLNGDAIDEKNTTFGQHKTRIEAFLERKACERASDLLRASERGMGGNNESASWSFPPS